MRGEYAALSYCWGDPLELQQNPPYRATASTLSALRAGFLITDLPLTIRQAVYVCKVLGLRYIWVDSLCIIQDSTLDWQIEAAKMGAIYSMSVVTIIAASSTSCHSGFLDQNLSAQPLHTSTELGFRIMARVSSKSGFHSQLGAVPDPLDSRGWAYHEEMVSSRYLKFCKDDIQWKCGTGTECICRARPRQGYAKQWNDADEESLKWAVNRVEGWPSRWDNIVDAISIRRFTYATDKLPALASLAERMMHQCPPPTGSDGSQRYLAGLWRGDLLRQLCWFTEGTWCLPSSFVAPTFSWASITLDPLCGYRRRSQRLRFTNHLSNFGCKFTPSSEVLNARTDLVFGGSEFGRVSGGLVSIRGPVLPCRLSYQPLEEVYGSNHTFHESEECSMSGLRLETLPSIEVFQHSGDLLVYLDCPVTVFTNDQGQQFLQRSQTFGAFGFQEIDVAILVLLVSEASTVGIVLTQEGSSQGYQRIGYSRLPWNSNARYWYSDARYGYLTEVLKPFIKTVTIY